jgi:hypothetical protein
MKRQLTTQSLWRAFLDCRKYAFWRFEEQLVPLQRERALSFGTLIHECLEMWHRLRDLPGVLTHIDRACPNRAYDEEQRRTWHLATAMMKGYTARYAQEDFEVVCLEKTFEMEVVNPRSGAKSRSFTFGGKVDGIVRIGVEHFLLEHKTAAAIDGSYLERLWMDFQISAYTLGVEHGLGIPIAGILYNVLVKPRLQQSAGETEAEFEARRAELIAKSKTGTTTAKRRLPESDDEFQSRLAAKYTDPAMFHRERLCLSRSDLDRLRSELWELTQEYLRARRHKVWHQNTSACFRYGKPCPYFGLCRSDGNPNVVENLYERVAPHGELQRASAADEGPAF